MVKWLKKILGRESITVEKQLQSIIGKYDLIEDPTSRSGLNSTYAQQQPGRDAERQQPEPERNEGRSGQNSQDPALTRGSTIERLILELKSANNIRLRCAAAEELGRYGKEASRAIPFLLISAVDRDAEMRRASLATLNTIDPDWSVRAESIEAIPRLLAELRGSRDVQKAAFELLAIFGTHAVPYLLTALEKEEDTVEKLSAIRLLGRLGPSATIALPLLAKAMNATSSDIRLAAAEALLNYGERAEPALPDLVTGLTDASADVRKATADCLAGLGSACEPAVPSLLLLLADREQRVRGSASDALRQVGPKIVPLLIEIIRQRNAPSRKAWFDSIMKVHEWIVKPPPDIVARNYRQELNSRFWAAWEIRQTHASLEAARAAALRLLGNFGNERPEVIPFIIASLSDETPEVKLASILALDEIGVDAGAATPKLIPILAARDERLRNAALKSLNNINSRWRSHPAIATAVDAITAHLANASEEGKVAIEALALVGAAAVESLISALGSEDRIVRENAAKCLGQIGADAKGAIPALTLALQDQNRWVQEAAAKALQAITQQAGSP